MEQITVRVPATTANMGPGFDCIGCAFKLYNTIKFEKSEKLIISGCEEKYQNADNLAFLAFSDTLKRANHKAENVKITFLDTNVPVSRGLGSSSTLFVAGAFAANELYGLKLEKKDILDICNNLEGHPDNLSPAIYGGMTASLLEDGKPVSVRYNISEKISFTALIPDFELETKIARSVLPEFVSFKDAVFNASHLAVLLKGFENGDRNLIRTALKDKLHQPYRFSLIKGFETAKNIAESLGCIAFCISGAGPTCLCVSDDSSLSKKISDSLKGSEIENWKVLKLDVDYTGVQSI